MAELFLHQPKHGGGDALHSQSRTTTRDRRGASLLLRNKRADERRAREWTGGNDEAVLIHILADRIL